MEGNNSLDVSSLRIKYLERTDIFHENDLRSTDPLIILKEWMEIALNSEDVLEPNAACLATADKYGIPSNRFILVKEVTSDGLIFYTNYGSKKAQDIEINPYVALTFYWCPLRRSVRIQGKAEKIPSEYSLNYFRQRPRNSQISALASAQSTVIKNREALEEIEFRIKAEMENKEIPLPNWGGYLIRPQSIEFWQGQTNRLHDRIRFRQVLRAEKIENIYINIGENGWVYERLAP